MDKPDDAYFPRDINQSMVGSTDDNFRESSLMMPSIVDKSKSFMEDKDGAENL